jgi:hypothetical protein
MRPPIKLLLSALFISALLPGAAKAQQCGIFEEILTPRKPVFGVPPVWDQQYGSRDFITQVAGAVPLESGTVMLAGRRLDPASQQPVQTFLAEINNRGRAVSENFFKAKPGESPVQMIRSGDGFAVLSSIKAGSKDKSETQARVAWYKRDGGFIREKTFRADGYNYEARSLAADIAGTGAMIAIHAISRKAPDSDQYSVVYHLGKDGSVIWKRAYKPGAANQFNKIVQTADKNFLAVGSLRLDDGRFAGWAVKLTQDGAIYWQRAYPRGKWSGFSDAAAWSVPGEELGDFALTGTVVPVDDTPASAWVMTIDGAGAPVWQRYFHRDDARFTGAFISRAADGRFTAVANEDNAKDIPDHIRLFTFSAEGTLTNDEAYLNGLNARAAALGTGMAGERVVGATIAADFQPEEDEKAAPAAKDLVEIKKTEPGDAKPPVKTPIAAVKKIDPKAPALSPVQPKAAREKGWVLVAVPLPPYNDPCQPKPPSTGELPSATNTP